MGDTRICKDCGKEFDIKDMAKGKTRGIEYIRKQCKACFNFQSNRNRKKTDKQYTPRSNIQEGMMNKLSEDQFVKLEILIEHHNELMSIINSKIDINQADRSQRVHKTFNVDKGLYVILDKHAKKKNVSVSDILNAVIAKGIEFL